MISNHLFLSIVGSLLMGFGQLIRKIKDRFSDDQVIFRYKISLSLCSLSFIFLSFVLFLLYILLKIDLIFFNANQFPGAREIQDIYFDFIFSNTIELLPYVFVGMILIFFMGIYLTHLMLRPFKLLSRYCEDITNGKKANFNPEMFADHKLLVMFSDYFFSTTEQMLEQKKFKQISIPDKYTRVHRPVYDWSFFISYILLIAMVTGASLLGVIAVDSDIREQIITLSTSYLKTTATVKYFMSEQFIVFDIVLYVLIMFHIFLHFAFGVFLYSKVAAPAFAIFSTMRSFLKGNKNARIHMIGYSYLREDCRKINKYLDLVAKLPE